MKGLAVIKNTYCVFYLALDASTNGSAMVRVRFLGGFGGVVSLSSWGKIETTRV